MDTLGSCRGLNSKFFLDEIEYAEAATATRPFRPEDSCKLQALCSIYLVESLAKIWRYVSDVSESAAGSIHHGFISRACLRILAFLKAGGLGKVFLRSPHLHHNSWRSWDRSAEDRGIVSCVTSVRVARSLLMPLFPNLASPCDSLLTLVTPTSSSAAPGTVCLKSNLFNQNRHN